jgi:Fe-S-cluster containining protein
MDGNTPCRQCGHCCGPYFALYVDEPDEQRWASEGRKDLLERLEWERERVRWDDSGPYHVETHEPFSVCFFLARYPDGRALCSIHGTKPRICRDYPPGSSRICALFRGQEK